MPDTLNQTYLLKSIVLYPLNFLRRVAGRSNSIFLAMLVTAMDYFQVCIRYKRIHERLNLHDTREIEILDELKKNGIYIYENFWDKNKCAKVRQEIEHLILDVPEYIHPSPRADIRIFGAENLSSIISEFSDYNFLKNIASNYNQEKTKAAFTLAAKMPAREGNLGSGEGWHRDAFFRQFKAIIYLSDVDETNGPFQFIAGSHKIKQVLKDMWKAKLAYMESRIDDSQVKLLLEQDSSRLKTYTAKAGTLILVDTSAIHRGKPIETGERFALTNYYFPEIKIGKLLYEQFAPVAGIIDKDKNFINVISKH